jgi:hypothetical protein
MTPTGRAVAGFWAAGAFNVLGVLAFSRAGTNTYLSELYPDVFSGFGLLCVVLWGLAYVAAGGKRLPAAELSAVFALEKAVYVGTWVVWLARHGGTLPAVWDRDPLTATFYAIYGAGDLAFGLFFAWAAWRARTKSGGVT